MKYNILVTGGAGLVGSHLADELIRGGHKVLIYDNLESQVHRGKKPDYLNPDAEFIKDDIRNRSSLVKAVKRVDIIFHEAAAVGVGQSMYEVDHYVDVNTRGTALLLDILVNEKNKVKKLIVASSMANYGEGLYKCDRCKLRNTTPRPIDRLQKHIWEKLCPQCHSPMRSMPTAEDKEMTPASIYALTKRDQEEMCLLIGRAYDIPVVALRYFNIYGPRQAISNPYTGVIAIFSSRLLNNQAPIIFEDGLQERDFVHVRDIVGANILAMEKDSADYAAINVGTGKATPIIETANILKVLLRKDIKPTIVNKFRKGDVRHCYADTKKAKELLGFVSGVELKDGLKELLEWLQGQRASDNVEIAKKQLEDKGLVL